MEREEFKDMIGRTMSSITGSVGDEEMLFTAEDSSTFRFHYERDCCAACSINDIAGDISDLIGSPILQAEVTYNCEDNPPEYEDSFTWSFYKFRTNKGDVTVSWLGQSNGYYSETVTYTKEVK